MALVIFTTVSEMVEIAWFGRTAIPLMLRQQPLFWWRTPAEEMAWLPPIEVFDKKDKLVVRAEVPSMKPEEIDISVSDSTLTIKGKGKSESEVKEEDYYRRRCPTADSRIPLSCQQKYKRIR